MSQGIEKYIKISPTGTRARAMFLFLVLLSPLRLIFYYPWRRHIIVHFTDLLQAFHSLWISKVLGCKVVATIHDMGPFLRRSSSRSLWNRIWNLIFRLGVVCVVKSAHKIVAVSSQTEHEIARYFSHSVKNITERLVLIPHGVDGKFFLANSRDLSKGEVVIGCVGALIKRKRVEKGIKVCAMLNRRRVPCRMIIVGDGPLQQELRELAGREGVADRVLFQGHVNDVLLPKMYEMMDVLLHPSRYEGFGYPILEAQAAGVPVIIFTDASIPPEVSRTALKAKSIQEAASIVQDFLENRELYTHQSIQACRNARMFSLSKMLELHCRLYTSI